jgi:hypothetical protein
MDERTTYPYRGYTISTFQEEGVWWATARPVKKEAGGRSGDRGRAVEEPTRRAERCASVLRQSARAPHAPGVGMIAGDPTAGVPPAPATTPRPDC